MQSPENQNENNPLPAGISILEVSHSTKSPSDNISQLSQTSASGLASFSSPIGAKDIGVPRTPEVRVVRPTDESAIDQGYDSDGLRAPWEGSKELNFDGPEVEEQPLPCGPPSSSSECQV